MWALRASIWSAFLLLTSRSASIQRRDHKLTCSTVALPSRNSRATATQVLRAASTFALASSHGGGALASGGAVGARAPPDKKRTNATPKSSLRMDMNDSKVSYADDHI